MYEITSLTEGHVWTGARLVGLIVSADKPGRQYTNLPVHKLNGHRPFACSIYVDLVGITFRPLNQRDQAKIEKENARGS